VTSAVDESQALADYIDWFVRVIVNTRWWSFAWGGSRRLRISQRGSGFARAVRLQLPGDDDVLHLTGLRLDISGRYDLFRFSEADIQVTACSLYGSDSPAQNAEVLAGMPGQWVTVDREPTWKTLLHTGREEAPYFHVQLPAAVQLESLTIGNREGPWGFRSGTLDVSLLRPDDSWEKVVSLDSERAALQTATHPTLFRGSDRLDLPVAESIWSGLWTFMLTSELPEAYDAWTTAFRSVRAGSHQDVRANPLARVNESLFNHLGYNLGPHGINVSFAQRDDETIRRMIFGGTELARDLVSMGYDSCLGFGTALGFARDGAPIPHDDDVDVLASHIDCSCADRQGCMSELARLCTLAGYTVSGTHRSHLWISKGFMYDVFVAEPRGTKDVCNFLVGDHSYEHDVQDLFPAISLRFTNGSYGLFPRNIVGYVEKVYGASWRKPDPAFMH
jgi:hypothetical protein